MRNRKATKLIALALVLVFALAVVGCGGGSTNTPAPAPAPAPASPAPAPAPAPGGATQPAPEPSENAVRPSDDTYELVDLTYLDRAWDLDPDVLGRFEFTFTTHEPLDSRKNRFCREWADVIYKATRGGVEIVNFPSQTLATSADALAATQMALADFAWTIGPNWVTQYPILGMFNYATMGMDAPTLAVEVMWDLLEENESFRNEMYNDTTRVIMLYSTGGTGIHGNTRIETLADFQGLKCRVLPGTGVDMLQRLGGSPINMGPPDMYDALSKGILDGYAIDWTGITAFKLHEVTKWYSTNGLWQTPMMIIMNNNSWNSLPAEYQEVINYYSNREMSLQHGYVWESEVYEESQRLSTPDQHITFSDDVWASIVEMGLEYNLERASAVNVPGFDAPKFLDRIYEVTNKYLDEGYKYYQRYW